MVKKIKLFYSGFMLGLLIEGFRFLPDLIISESPKGNQQLSIPTHLSASLFMGFNPGGGQDRTARFYKAIISNVQMCMQHEMLYAKKIEITQLVFMHSY